MASTGRTAISTRTALVGGGASGIGFATAEALARDGLQVVISGRRPEALAESAARLRDLTATEVEWVVSDIGEPVAARRTVDEVEARFGGLDVLVLNAGGPRPGRILDVGDETWQAAIELILLGPLRFARLALPRMAERGFGRVLFVTSTAVRQPQPNLATSVVLRSATTSAAKLLAREFAADGVTVNCVAPGATNTGRRREIIERQAHAAGVSLEDADAADIADIPAGRAAEPREVAAALRFLASDEASFINGTVLTVDGGRTETI